MPVVTFRADAVIPPEFSRDIRFAIRAFNGETTIIIDDMFEAFVPFFLANKRAGTKRKTNDFPYPVGNIARTSTFKKSFSKHITCLGFKITSQYKLFITANSKQDKKNPHVLLFNMASIAVNIEGVYLSPTGRKL